MQVLEVLSKIWKSGGKTSLLENNKIKLDDAVKVPKETLEAAEKVFPQIEEWFVSWKDASNADKMAFRAFSQFCGWQHDQAVNHWLTNDLESIDLVDRWIKAMERNGYKNIYEDYRPYENDKSNQLKNELFKRAVAFGKGAKQ